MPVACDVAVVPGVPGDVPERAWLTLFAEVTDHPPTTLPCARIAGLLCETFASSGCSYSHVVDDVVIGGLVLSGDEEIAPQVRGPSGQVGAAGVAAMAVWDGLPRASRCDDLLPLPLSRAPAGTLAFVVGRNRPFRSADRSLAATLWTLLTTLHPRRRPGGAAEVPPGGSISLTARELDVLAHLAEGLTAAAIARRLRISVRTVHKHLERIYAKLDVTNRLAAVQAARRLGLGAR